jgi:hypothetical protein
MPEPKGNDMRTLAVRVSPDFHAQLSMAAQVDGVNRLPCIRRDVALPPGVAQVAPSPGADGRLDTNHLGRPATPAHLPPSVATTRSELYAATCISLDPLLVPF